MKSYPVSIIIPNWNGKHFLKQNMSSVLNQDYPVYSIFLVDNNSNDGSRDYIRMIQKKHPTKISVIENKTNLGFTGSNNIAVEEIITNEKSKYIVFLNNDVKVEKEWLSNLITGFTKESIGIVTSKLLYYYPYQRMTISVDFETEIRGIQIDDLLYPGLIFSEGFRKKGEPLMLPLKLESGKKYYFAISFKSKKSSTQKIKVDFVGGPIRIDLGKDRIVFNKAGNKEVKVQGKYIIQNAGTKFNKDKKLFEEKKIYEFDHELKSQIVDAGNGAGMAVRTVLIKNLGSFKKKYFAYGEDTELSYRLKVNGFKTKFVANAVGYHYLSGSSGKRITSTQTFYGSRNRLWFIREYFGFWQFAYYYLRMVVRTFIWGVKAILDKEAYMYFKSYIKALLSSLGF
ncbi:MAG: glycosyltransferase family 2 protein [Patescibacteria group bacterium]|nr:glycosyltransferase family 2 protein [Patescibacteria group bacterium]